MNGWITLTALAGLGCLPVAFLLEFERRRNGDPKWESMLTVIGQLALGTLAFGHALVSAPWTIAALVATAALLSNPVVRRLRVVAPSLAAAIAVACPLLLRHSAHTFDQITSTLNIETVSVIVIWLSVAVVLGGACVELILKIASSGSGAADIRGLMNGGRAIGWIERIIMFLSILAHQPSGIALVVAVKSVARFPEFRGSDPATGSTPETQSKAEAFIIGTLSSVLFAVVPAYVAMHILQGTS